MRKLRLREADCFAHVLFLPSLWLLNVRALMQMLLEAWGSSTTLILLPVASHFRNLGVLFFFPAFWDQWRILWLSPFRGISWSPCPNVLPSHLSEEMCGWLLTWLMMPQIQFWFICVRLFLSWLISHVNSKGICTCPFGLCTPWS